MLGPLLPSALWHPPAGTEGAVAPAGAGQEQLLTQKGAGTVFLSAA
jgi:hypothetical protein